MEESEIIPERFFRGFEIVPEGGLRYSEMRGTMLIFEFCTRSNFKHGGVMKSKLTRYLKYLPQMEAKFKRSITVLFVIDIERSKIKDFVSQASNKVNQAEYSVFNGSSERSVGSVADGDQSASPEGDRFPSNPFRFTDYQSFKSVPVGKALSAKIYFWNDEKEWRLTGND